MAAWTAKCWLGSENGYQDLEVRSNTVTGAKKQFESIYGAEQVINIREVRSGGTGGASSTDTGTIISIASFAVLVWIFITFMPWIFMGLGGTLGAWIGKKTGKVSLAIVLSILAGGYGFYQGNQWQQEWNESGTIEEVKSVQE